MRRLLLGFLLLISSSTLASVSIEDVKCCRQTQRHRKIPDKCKAILSDQNRCEVVVREFHKELAHKKVQYKNMQRLSTALYILEVLVLAGLTAYYIWRKNKTGAAKRAPAVPARRPSKPRTNLGSYE